MATGVSGVVKEFLPVKGGSARTGDLVRRRGSAAVKAGKETGGATCAGVPPPMVGCATNCRRQGTTWVTAAFSFGGAKVTASEATLSGIPKEADSTVCQERLEPAAGTQGGKEEEAKGFTSPKVPHLRPLAGGSPRKGPTRTNPGP